MFLLNLLPLVAGSLFFLSFGIISLQEGYGRAFKLSLVACVANGLFWAILGKKQKIKSTSPGILNSLEK